MEFGEIAAAEAEGTILAHTVRHGGVVFKKGRKLSAADIAKFTGAGVTNVFAARLGPDDIPEDEAAAAIAAVAGGPGANAQAPFTGRANLHAGVHGIALVDGERVNALNRVHESLTFATVAHHAVVDERQMVATVKVIPFAVPRDALARALEIIGSEPVIRVEGFRHCDVGLVITRLAQTKPALLAKSEQSMRERVAALDGVIGEVVVCDHSIEAVGSAVARLQAKHRHPILVFGASAIVDRGDVVPAGVVAAGGEIVHLGMPVDPGNLMLFARLGGVPVIGVPSCTRSPKLNGFDWVLERVMAGLHVSAEDIMDMGAGGLLAEIPSRPSPREGRPKAQHAPRVVALVLAAGQSRRMGSNKLLADLGGKPMIRRTVEAVLGAVDKAIVVTGNAPDAIAEALAGLAVETAHNADYESGLASSLKRGISALPSNADAMLVVLGDMPLVDAEIIRRLIAAFNPAEHRSICAPVHQGTRGNPVLWGRQHFSALQALEGDKGARALLDRLSEELVEVEMPGDAILLDADTPEALATLRSAGFA